jgi:hypothetical protein
MDDFIRTPNKLGLVVLLKYHSQFDELGFPLVVENQIVTRE